MPENAFSISLLNYHVIGSPSVCSLCCLTSYPPVLQLTVLLRALLALVLSAVGCSYYKVP